MKKMNATEFKAKCLKILEQLDSEGLIITKHGKPIARVMRLAENNQFDDLFGVLKGKLKTKGNIFSTGAKWNAQS